jgi:hypothetical protein
MEQTFSSKFTRFALKALIVAVVVFVLYTWLVLKWSYATGERAGYVQKLSLKGYVCKTWEGELAMVNVPGALTEKFVFTVRDDAVANKINQLLGKRVVLNYEQHVGVPTSCFGDTSYFVTDAREVSDGTPSGQAQPVPTAPTAPPVPPAPSSEVK